mmetsp:Transcript_29455/g.83944  ORF Transcript_29455/g.83944 Transcript_29455/m.83944 type:complete len:227 (-) Transcript_29455:435-1115(-)
MRKSTGCARRTPMEMEGRKASEASSLPAYAWMPSAGIPRWKRVIGTISEPLPKPMPRTQANPMSFARILPLLSSAASGTDSEGETSRLAVRFTPGDTLSASARSSRALLRAASRSLMSLLAVARATPATIKQRAMATPGTLRTREPNARTPQKKEVQIVMPSIMATAMAQPRAWMPLTQRTCDDTHTTAKSAPQATEPLSTTSKLGTSAHPTAQTSRETSATAVLQ